MWRRRPVRAAQAVSGGGKKAHISICGGGKAAFGGMRAGERYGYGAVVAKPAGM